MKPINLPLTFNTWSELEHNAILNVMASGQLTMGNHVRSCEKKWSEWLGSPHSVMVNSGSSANLLMVASLFFKKKNPLKAGDVVVVPSVGWSTSFSPLQQYGLKLRFVDIDKETFNFDLKKLSEAVDDSVKAIFCINLLGNSNDFDSIKKIIGGKNIYLLEDNCESMGATFNRKKAGTFGILSSHSTYFSHHISTIEGGFINTSDEELHHILLSLRAHGWTRELPENNILVRKSHDSFEEKFRFILPGYNVRPTEFSGALGVQQIDRLDRFIKFRRQNAEIFQSLFSDHRHVSIQREVGQSSWFGFGFILKSGVSFNRTDLLKRLFDLGVETRPIVSGNFLRQPVLQFFNYEVSGDIENSELIHNCGFFIGNHPVDLKPQLESLKIALDEL